MKDNKLVLKYCPNFYKIMNMDFQEGDNISTKLVDIYEEKNYCSINLYAMCVYRA